MSDEITITVSGNLNNATGSGSTPLYDTFSHGSAQVDQATKKKGGDSQGLTASWEEVVTGDVTSGFVFLTNLDATYNVDYGPQQTGSAGEGEIAGTILPGDPPALLHLAAGITYMARASGGSGATATVDVTCWSR